MNGRGIVSGFHSLAIHSSADSIPGSTVGEGIYPVEPKRRDGVFLKLLDARNSNAVTLNPDFGCGEWPGGIDLCPATMPQAMTGSAAEGERLSPLALRADAEKNR